MSVEFLITVLVIVATPGTGMIYSIAAGLSRGSRSGVLAALACTVGVLPHIAAAITGLAALLHASATAFAVIKYAGVAYLLYMAWMTFRDKSELTTEAGPSSFWRIMRSGLVVNLLNPKLTIFFFAFLPQFVRPGSGAVGQMLELSAVFMAATFAVFALCGVFAGVLRERVISRPKVVAWMRRTFAGGFVVLAGKLALTER